MKPVSPLIIAIIALSFAIGLYLYPTMPELMASHWNALGNVDSYMDKIWALFIMPAVSMLLYLLFELIPRIDPLRENIKKFREYFDGFVLMILVFLFYLYLLSIAWNLGFVFDFNLFIVPAFSILLYYCGILIENAKRNWFIGIRTPWTISSEKVWNKTHKKGGKLFKLAGIIALAGILLQDYALWFVLLPIIGVTAYLVAYSYFEYRKEV